MADHSARKPAERGPPPAASYDGVVDRDTNRHEAWRAKVRAYIHAGDRGEEPHFVGRDALFEQVQGMLDAARAGQRQGRTIVVGGAPGAGKTAFVRELVKRTNAAHEALAVEVPVDDMNPLGLFGRLLQTLGLPERNREERTTKRGAGCNVQLAKGDAARSTTTISPGDRELLKDSDSVPWEMLKERFAGHLGPDCPLILLCDEAQNLGESEATRTFARSLHLGDLDGNNPLPLVPVFTGLADARQRLRRCGITRLTSGNALPIGELSRAESEEYALKTMEHLEARGSDGEKAGWARWFVDHCDGWPQHLRDQMSAVGEGMLEADTPTLQALDGGDIAKRASARRNEHYGQRLEATEREEHRGFFASLASMADGSGASIGDLLQAARDHVGRDGDARALVNDAIHAGIVQRRSASEPDRYVCPVPSLRRWLHGAVHVVPPPPSTKERGSAR